MRHELGKSGPAFELGLDEATRIAWVIDLAESGRRSVTNGAEEVCTFVVHVYGGDAERIIYRDTMGRWDELRLKRTAIGRTFAGFAYAHDDDAMAVAQIANLEFVERRGEVA